MPCTTDSEDQLFLFNVPLRLTKPEVERLARAADKHSDFDTAPISVSSGTLVERAKWLYQFELKRRSQPGIETSLGDPSWMILLDLYVRDAQDRSTNISSATLASGAPQTTGLRHVSVLESKGYIHRSAHPSDERCVLLWLTDFGRKSISDVLRHAVYPI